MAYDISNFPNKQGKIIVPVRCPKCSAEMEGNDTDMNKDIYSSLTSDEIVKFIKLFDVMYNNFEEDSRTDVALFVNMCKNKLYNILKENE